jgi:hypothetical protein
MLCFHPVLFLKLRIGCTHCPFLGLLGRPMCSRWQNTTVRIQCLGICPSQTPHRAQYYSPDPSMIFSGVVACATEARFTSISIHPLA